VSDTKFGKIAQIIEKRIDKGEYTLNSQLPTHRDLADELGTTPVTIAKAYKLLVEKGRVESFVGKGTFVCKKSNLNLAIQAPEDDKDFNFSILQPCLYQNLEVLRRAYEYASHQLTSDLIGYVEHSGHKVHRQSGVTWAKNYGLEGGSVDNTLLTNGAQHALFLLVNALTQPGDTIAVESLTYPGIMAVASLTGRHIVAVPIDNEGMNPQALENVIAESNPSLVIIVPSHQNPTGITMPESRRRQIAEIINRTNRWLVEDDIYGFLNENVIPAICNFAPSKTFHISSLSKVISPAMRCGYVKAPESQIGLLNAHIRTNTWLSSPMNYIAASHLVDTGQAFELADSQRRIAAERQSMARKIFPELPSHLTGYHIWLPLPDRWKSDKLMLEAKHKNLLISGGSYFDVSGKESDHVRLSLMSLNSEEKLIEGLSMLKELINSDINILFPF
jgi:DNA-binding transcriptional MocR family regulator